MPLFQTGIGPFEEGAVLSSFGRVSKLRTRPLGLRAARRDSEAEVALGPGPEIVSDAARSESRCDSPNKANKSNVFNPHVGGSG